MIYLTFSQSWHFFPRIFRDRENFSFHEDGKIEKKKTLGWDALNIQITKDSKNFCVIKFSRIASEKASDFYHVESRNKRSRKGFFLLHFLSV